MSTIKNYKHCLMLFNEWKKNNKDPDEAAKIINERLGKNSVTSKEARYHFRCFNKNENAIFEDNSSLKIKKEGTEKIDSLLFMTDDKLFGRKTSTIDGRFMLFIYEDSPGKFFLGICDLFRNVTKLNPFPSYAYNFEVIGTYLLAFDGENEYFCLFKVNYNDLKIVLLDSIKLNEGFYCIHPDQLNDHKFVIDQSDKIAQGQIQIDKIILDEPKDYSRFHHARLIDGKLQGFDYYRNIPTLLKFYELDLDTMERKEFDAPIVLNDEPLNVLDLWEDPYHWSKNHCYGILTIKNNDYIFYIVMFNLETLKWLNIGISANEPRSLFIDSNEILTLHVGRFYKSQAFYRISLRKPDLLSNLSWLAALKQSTLLKNHKYLEHAKRLPIKL